MSIMQDSTIQTKAAATISAAVSGLGVFGSTLELGVKVVGIILSLLLIVYWIRKDRREERMEGRQQERHNKDMQIKDKKLQSLKKELLQLKKKDTPSANK